MIIEKVKEQKVMFKELKNGDVFRCNGVYFMKTDDIYDEEEEHYNCVRLVNGSFENIEIFTLVEVVEAKLIIE